VQNILLTCFDKSICCDYELLVELDVPMNPIVQPPMGDVTGSGVGTGAFGFGKERAGEEGLMYFFDSAPLALGEVLFMTGVAFTVGT